MGQINAREGTKQILAASDNGFFKLHPDNLESILLADDVINKPVVVISVAGACRKGKSFLLDMMLRYLTASDKLNWVNEKNTQGFPWRRGCRRLTTGILMWSQPIPVTLPTGEEAVIVLMDTQGTFDNRSTVHESSTVFALSTLLSSLQIVNVKNNVNDDDLEHLQQFIEYGRMVFDDTSSKSFQKLLFLVRDWQNIHEIPLGAAGGDRLVTEWLLSQSWKDELVKVCDEVSDMTAEVCSHISDCFSEINGFLLPHPGKRVATLNFDGSSDDMDPAFVAGLEELMPKILAPENLTIKTIAGSPIKAKDLYIFFTSYVDLFQTDNLPKPENIMQATAEAINMAAVQEAKSQYIKEMECLVRENEPSIDQDKLFRKHREAATKAEKAFNDQKMGDRKTSQEHLKKLVQEMKEWFGFAEQANSTKREKEKLDAKEKKRLDAENHIIGLIGTCRMTYISKMEPVVGETVGYVPRKDMDSAHSMAKQEAMDKFDAGSKGYFVEWDSRFKLAQVIGAHFRLMLFHNGVNEDNKKPQVAQANMKAVELAHKCYHTVMKATTPSGVMTEEIECRHQQALQAALSTFASLKEGEEDFTEGYLQSLKKLIDEDHEMETYIASNQKKTAKLGNR